MTLCFQLESLPPTEESLRWAAGSFPHLRFPGVARKGFRVRGGRFFGRAAEPGAMPRLHGGHPLRMTGVFLDHGLIPNPQIHS
jgi:hypothetical protein